MILTVKKNLREEKEEKMHWRKNAFRGTIKTLLEDDKEITTLSEISFTLKNCYENLFQKTITKSISDIEMFSSDIHSPTIHSYIHLQLKC